MYRCAQRTPVRADAARAALLTPIAKAFSTDIGNEWLISRSDSRRHGLHRGDRRRQHYRDARNHPDL